MNDFISYFSVGWEHIIDLEVPEHIFFIAALAATSAGGLAARSYSCYCFYSWLYHYAYLNCIYYSIALTAFYWLFKNSKIKLDDFLSAIVFGLATEMALQRLPWNKKKTEIVMINKFII